MTTFWWVFLGACVFAIVTLFVVAIFMGAGAANAAMDQARDSEGPEEL